MSAFLNTCKTLTSHAVFLFERLTKSINKRIKYLNYRFNHLSSTQKEFTLFSFTSFVLYTTLTWCSKTKFYNWLSHCGSSFQLMLVTLRQLVYHLYKELRRKPVGKTSSYMYHADGWIVLFFFYLHDFCFCCRCLNSSEGEECI